MINKLFLKGDAVIAQPVTKIEEFSAKKFTWIRVLEPSAEEVSLLARFLSFDEAALDDFQSFLQDGSRSRIEKDTFLQVIFAVPVIVNKEIDVEELMVFSQRNILITVERKKLSICETYANRAIKGLSKYLFSRNAGFFFTEIIDEANTRFLHHVNKIEHNIDVLSAKGTLLTTSQVEAISSANNTLSFFNQATLANIEVLNSLRKMHHSTFLLADRETFSDMYFDALQILDALKIQREMIMNLFNIQSIISSNQMNMFMKKLTALALIIMVPTLISGIYGMNVSGLPFAHLEQGFWFVLGLLIIITGIIYFFFKKVDWV